jgi:DNA-binding PadR family transcriptional regulator
VSSIRLFVLGSLDQRGPMHGHQMRLLAEEEHVDIWTGITVGAVYGALKRLESEHLITAVRTERSGNYPERKIFDITEQGRAVLAEVRAEALTRIEVRPDPVDLALTRLDTGSLDELESVVRDRLDEFRRRLAEREAHIEHITQYLTVAEQVTVTHATDRLRAEVTFHERLLAAVPQIVADELSRKDRP